MVNNAVYSKTFSNENQKNRVESNANTVVIK